jgi:N-acyl-D-aspartate/D-glutamate deacylase
MTFDTVIYNAEIIDGTGAEGYPADLAVKNGRIVKIGQLGHHAAGNEIDAAGSVVTPGFIDSHSHADLALLATGLENEKLKMGVTAEVIGQCGFSAFPISPEYKALQRQGMSGFLPGVELVWTWSDLTGYKKTAQKKGLTHHVIPLAGHGSLRQAVMGDSSAEPTAAQMEKMRKFADTAMEQGAYGLSSGLIYSPGVFSQTEEQGSADSSAVLQPFKNKRPSKQTIKIKTFFFILNLPDLIFKLPYQEEESFLEKFSRNVID